MKQYNKDDEQEKYFYFNDIMIGRDIHICQEINYLKFRDHRDDFSMEDVDDLISSQNSLSPKKNNIKLNHFHSDELNFSDDYSMHDQQDQIEL